MAASFDFAKLRDHLDEAVAELDGRLAEAGDVGDDISTLGYRRDIVFFNIARSFADALASCHPGTAPAGRDADAHTAPP